MFLGPFALAAAVSNGPRQLLLAALVLVGVVLVTRPVGDVSIAGVALGLAAAASLTGYTISARRLGKHAGIDGLALATVCSAVLLAPVAVGHAASPGPMEWAVLIALGALGVTVTFACDFFALKMVGSRVVSTLFALDPVIGAVLGVVVLADPLTWPLAVGIGLIVTAGGATMATAPTGRASRGGSRRGLFFGARRRSEGRVVAR